MYGVYLRRDRGERGVGIRRAMGIWHTWICVIAARGSCRWSVGITLEYVLKETRHCAVATSLATSEFVEPWENELGWGGEVGRNFDQQGSG